MSPPALFILHQGALGDLVCIFPVLKMLRRYFRPVALLCQGQLGRLAQAENLVDTWFPIEAAWTASLYAGEAGPEARRILAPYSHMLVFTRSAALAAALRQVGEARVCCVPPRLEAHERIHVAEGALRHILECGLLPEPGAAGLRRMPPVPSSPQGCGLARVLIHPGAGSPRKRWRLSGFLELAQRIQRYRMRPAFVIGPAETDLFSRLEMCGATIYRPGDILDLTALLRSAAVYIGNDSGVSHLAAWLGLACVVIFGPSDPMRWRPMGRSVEVVRPSLDCSPCFETAGENCADEGCLTRITVQDVEAAFERAAAAGGNSC